MKPQSFAYIAPETLDGVLDLLAQVGDDAVVIAGGQSLVPMLNLRLARPEWVIDLRRVTELARFEISAKNRYKRWGSCFFMLMFMSPQEKNVYF